MLIIQFEREYYTNIASHTKKALQFKVEEHAIKEIYVGQSKFKIKDQQNKEMQQKLLTTIHTVNIHISLEQIISNVYFITKNN